ncbi:MAG: hypothetical protein RPR91_05175 [Colwellia sp.]|jgi:hypothetical protein
MSNFTALKGMLVQVAQALGPEVLNEVAFVGGCTTGLHLTDEFSKENVRLTDDVDLIVSVVTRAGWYKFQEDMRAKGFKESMEDDHTCTMRLDGLQVDFLPDDESVLGFSSNWYEQGLKAAINYQLTSDIKIRLLTPPYFVATKFEAYFGRGNNDPLESRDIEDILNVFSGRAELVSEIEAAPTELKQYISKSISEVLKNTYFEYAVQSAANEIKEHERLIFERLDYISGLAA